MKDLLNTNTIHNVINILMTLSALVIAILLATGCTQNAVSGLLECSKSSISPTVTAYAIAGLVERDAQQQQDAMAGHMGCRWRLLHRPRDDWHVFLWHPQ